MLPRFGLLWPARRPNFGTLPQPKRPEPLDPQTLLYLDAKTLPLVSREWRNVAQL